MVSISYSSLNDYIFLKRDPDGREKQTDVNKVDINGMEKSRNLDISNLKSHSFICTENSAKLINKTDIPSEYVLRPSGCFQPCDNKCDENRDQIVYAQYNSINFTPYVSR